MDGLYRYLVEKFEITDAVNFIQGIINNPGENEKIIKAGYYAMQSDLKEKFSKYCIDKGFNEDQASLAWSVFVKHNAFDVAANIIDQGGVIEPTKILNAKGLTDISTLIPSGLDIDNQLLSDMMSIQAGKGGITVGPGELFLCLFVQGCEQDKTAQGDVIIDKMHVEVKKGSQAMLAGRKNPPSSKILYDNFKKYYPELYSGGTALQGKRAVEKLLSELKDKISDFTNNILGYGPKGGKKYFKEDHGLTEKYIEFLQRHENLSADDWLNSVALYGAMIYQKSEDFNYLLMISKDFSKLLVLDLGGETYDKLWSNIKDHWVARTGIYNAEGRNIMPKINL